MNEKVIQPEHYRRKGLPEAGVMIERILDGYSELVSEGCIFYLANAFKYFYRAPEKGGVEDLFKMIECVKMAERVMTEDSQVIPEEDWQKE